MGVLKYCFNREMFTSSEQTRTITSEYWYNRKGGACPLPPPGYASGLVVKESSGGMEDEVGWKT